ncbi:MAG: hypothetical protein VYA34_10965 [Myxococcota bacterium]|nr:hypothetical protein [Myxococcota bacterium]
MSRKLVCSVLSTLMAVALFLGTASFASAQDREVFKKRTVIDLSAAVIEGDLTRPEGSYIVNRKLSRFSQLIQERKDFLDELMMLSHNDL